MKTLYEVVSRHTFEEKDREETAGGVYVDVLLSPVDAEPLARGRSTFHLGFSEKDMKAAAPYQIGRRFVLVPFEPIETVGEG